jgi:putative phosphoribosyl transferase
MKWLGKKQRLRDREEAGRMLGDRLAAYKGRREVIVLGLPRGGVCVGPGIARGLQAELDVFLVRKLSVPGHEELAMGAISIRGVRILDTDVISGYQLAPGEVARVIEAEEDEMKRREIAHRNGRLPLDLMGRKVILVDDGVATGATMRAALAALRKFSPARVVLATGVAPVSTWERIESEADEAVSLITPREFRAVGEFYESFPQLTDDDVRALLKTAGGK